MPVIAEVSLSRDETKHEKRTKRLLDQARNLLWLFELPEILGITYYLMGRKESRQAIVRHSAIKPGSRTPAPIILERKVDLPKEFVFKT